MKHCNEEELIEHYYGEGGGGIQEDVQRHLQLCGECAEAYAALGRELGQMKAAEPPVRGARYGEQVWQSLSTSLPVHITPKGSLRSVSLWRGVSYAVAYLLLIAAAFVAGRRWEQNKLSSAAANHPQSRQQVVLVVLGDHLDRSERLLVELKHADANSADSTSPMQDEARELLASNEVCQKSVAQTNDPALAASLDHLGRVLAELAYAPGGLNRSTITRLQSEMNNEGLLFEVRVLRSRVPSQEPGKGIQSNGGTI